MLSNRCLLHKMMTRFKLFQMMTENKSHNPEECPATCSFSYIRREKQLADDDSDKLVSNCLKLYKAERVP